MDIQEKKKQPTNFPSTRSGEHSLFSPPCFLSKMESKYHFDTDFQRLFDL